MNSSVGLFSIEFIDCVWRAKWVEFQSYCWIFFLTSIDILVSHLCGYRYFLEVVLYVVENYERPEGSRRVVSDSLVERKTLSLIRSTLHFLNTSLFLENLEIEIHRHVYMFDFDFVSHRPHLVLQRDMCSTDSTRHKIVWQRLWIWQSSQVELRTVFDRCTKWRCSECLCPLGNRFRKWNSVTEDLFLWEPAEIHTGPRLVHCQIRQ